MKRMLFLSFTFAALTSFGVSRIGGGKVDSLSSGFEMEVASPFLSLDQYDDLVLANGPMGLAENRMVSQFIQLSEFTSLFPELSTASRSETRDFFQQKNWTRLNSADLCVEAYSLGNDSGTIIVMTWGQGKGVILQGPTTAMVKYAMEKTRQTLRLEPGACAWK